MRSKLAYPIYPFAVGIFRRKIRGAASSRSMVTSFGGRHCPTNSCFQAQGSEGSSRAVHSSEAEDDDFSELGQEISECSTKQIKLVTEKPDRFVKNNASGRELAGRSPSSDIRPRIQDIVATICQTSPTSSSMRSDRSHASTFTDDTRKTSEQASPGSVSIKNIQSTVGLSELVEAISVFGKVSSASFATASNGLKCCNIKFEDVGSSRKAILAGEIAVGNQVFPVHPFDAVDVVVIRIKNINKDTTDYAIHSRCKSVGEFLGLARTNKDVVEAFFNVRNDTAHLDILKKLNDTVIDLECWSAHVVGSKSKSSEVSADEEARHKLGLQMVDQFSKLKRQLGAKKVYLEDLENLSASILHIEGTPPTSDLSSSQ